MNSGYIEDISEATENLIDKVNSGTQFVKHLNVSWDVKVFKGEEVLTPNVVVEYDV